MVINGHINNSHKQWFLNRIIFILFFIISILFAVIVVQIKSNKQKGYQSDLPNFTFLTLGNTHYTNTEIRNISETIIFNFFSPTCEHCQYMATQYLMHKKKLKDIAILMVTIADSNSIVKFNKDYQLHTLPNVILLRDTKFQFYKTFGTASVPSFFIYEHQKLVKKIIGETKIENLIDSFTSQEVEK